MRDPRRRRIDYLPGPAALDALRLAAQRYPDLRMPALLDKLVITGLSALAHEHWIAPPLHGRDRHRWRVPGLPERP